MTSGFSNNGATPTQPSGGFLSSLGQSIKNFAFPEFSNQNQQPTSQPTLGTNPGLLPGVNSSSQQKTVTTTPDGSSKTVHPAQSNPSVLAQQQALNKLGAGLVEDGIAGPKTAAAIAKYGTPSSTTSSATPSASSTPTSTAPTTPPLTVAGQAPGVLSASDLQDNPQYQLLEQNNNKLTAASAAASEAGGANGFNNPLSPDQSASLGPDYQGLFNPNASPEVIAAEKGTLSPYLSTAINGNNAQIANMISAGQLKTQGAENVLGAVAPVGNTPYALNPATGTYTGSGTNAGTSATDAVQNAGMLSGLQAGAAAQAATGGNIAAQNATSLGTAETAANAQSIGNYTDQNTTISNSTAKLDNIAMGNNGSNGLIANMGTTGFNPASTPIGNQTYSQYFTNSNPAAKSGILAGLGEIQNQISNVISSSTGLTPTAVSAITNSYDLSTLNPEQLNDFLLYIKSYAQSNIAANQTTIDRLKSGGSVSGTPSLLPAPAPNSTGQAVVGTGATLGADLIGKIVSEAGNAVAGATAGAASGLAKSVLGI